MADDERFDGALLNMATQLEGGVPDRRSHTKQKYRSYTVEDLQKAYKLVKEKNYAVQTAADQFGIPESTLRDRVKGRIPMSIRRSGPPPVLGLHEEEKLVEYLNMLSSFGYGYSRTDIINIATDYAILLGKREPTDSFTHQWYYNFLNRWPGLEIKRASGTKKHFEKAMSIDCLSRYFNNLQALVSKHGLMSKPDSIFIVDEVLIDLDKSPPSVNSWRVNVKYERYKKGIDPTMTLIASGNGAGARLPAFFIFPGKTVSSESIEDCSPGTGATCSDEGTNNCNVFQLYLENHFLKFIERKSSTEPILLLYDGHCTHVSPALIELYLLQNVYLFPIPPTASQLLVTINRGIFGEFETNFDVESDQFMEMELEKSIHSNVCVVASKAYNSSVLGSHLKDVFQRSGIYPFKPTQVHKQINLDEVIPFSYTKKEKMIVVTPNSGTKTRRQALKRKPTARAKARPDSESENFEELESELFRDRKQKMKRRKKFTPPRKKSNYSNRRKSAAAVERTKQAKMGKSDGSDYSPTKPSLKLKFVRDTKASTSKRRKSPKSAAAAAGDDTDDSLYTDSDSELDDMLSSEEEETEEEFDSEQRAVALATSQRENFESALREELLSTNGLYFEGTQRERFEKEFEKAKSEFERAEAANEGLMDGTAGGVDDTEQEFVDHEGLVKHEIVIQNTNPSGEVLSNVEIAENVAKSETIELTVITMDEQQMEASGSDKVETGPTIVIESVEEEIPSSEKCCVCKQYHPDRADDGYVVEFATWGKCEFDRCEHWTHLKYCCNIKVLRRHDKFYCPCHNQI